MPAHMKVRPTKAQKSEATVTVKPAPEERTLVFEIPKRAFSEVMKTLNKLGTQITDRDSIPADDVFKHLDEKYGKAGAILRGARVKEGLTQEELATKAEIEQGDLSRMENGKLAIGRERAKRLGDVLKMDYRLFL